MRGASNPPVGPTHVVPTAAAPPGRHASQCTEAPGSWIRRTDRVLANERKGKYRASAHCSAEAAETRDPRGTRNQQAPHYRRGAGDRRAQRTPIPTRTRFDPTPPAPPQGVGGGETLCPPQNAPRALPRATTRRLREAPQRPPEAEARAGQDPLGAPRGGRGVSQRARHAPLRAPGPQAPPRGRPGRATPAAKTKLARGQADRRDARPSGAGGAPCPSRRHSGRPFGPGRPRRRPGMGGLGAPEPVGRDGKTRGFRPNPPPGRADRSPGPPLSPGGNISHRRTTGRPLARVRPGTAGTGPRPADRRPGGPDGAPRSPSVEIPAPRTHGGSLAHMHFSRGWGLRGLGSPVFSRVWGKSRLRVPSGDPGGSPGARAAPGRPNSRKTRHIWHAGDRKAAKTRGPRKQDFSGHGKTLHF